MSEKNKPFVINDRRSFTAEGDLRPDAPHQEPREAPRPREVIETKPEPPAPSGPVGEDDIPDMPPPPTAEQSEQANSAYKATTDRLDTAVRATNPGIGPIPELTFERFIQSIYMNALMQLGAAAPEGQEPRLDLLGARQTIDMIAMLAEKTRGNLVEAEEHFVSTALFELRMAFLEVTQALARAGAAKQGQPGAGPMPAAGGGPSIVR